MIPIRSQSWSASSMLCVVRSDRLARGVEVAEDLPEADAALRVEARGGLVEEEDGGVVQDRPRDHQALREPARERHHGRLGALGEAELHQQLVGGGPRCGGAHAEEAAVKVQVLPYGQGAVERVGLRHDADQLLGDRRVLDDIDIADECAARASGSTRVVSMLAVVVLPAPFGPSSPKISPSATVRLRPSTAVTPPG